MSNPVILGLFPEFCTFLTISIECCTVNTSIFFRTALEVKPENLTSNVVDKIYIGNSVSYTLTFAGIQRCQLIKIHFGLFAPGTLGIFL